MEQIKAWQEQRPQGQNDKFYIITVCAECHNENTAALSGDQAAWETEAEQSGNEEIAPASCIH